MLLFFFLTLGVYAIPEAKIVGLTPATYAIPILFLGFFLSISDPEQYKINLNFLSLCSLLTICVVVSLVASAFPNYAYSYNLILLIFIFYILTHFISKNVLSSLTVINCIFLSSLLAFAYGIYGFVTWRTGELSQHTQGYFGISYLSSTRNGDVLYLFIPFWYCLLKLIDRKQSGILHKAGLLLLLTIVTICIILSFSRSAWVSLVVTISALVALLAWIRFEVIISKLPVFFLIISILVPIYFLSPQEFREPIDDRLISIFAPESSDKLNSNLEREDLMRQAVRVSLSSPIFGKGPGSTSHYLRYMYSGPANHAESVYFTILIELGIFGLISYLFFSAYYLKLFLARVKGDASFPLLLSFTLFASFSIHGLFNLMIDSLWFWSVMALAFGLVLKRNYKGETKKNHN